MTLGVSQYGAKHKNTIEVLVTNANDTEKVILMSGFLLVQGET